MVRLRRFLAKHLGMCVYKQADVDYMMRHATSLVLMCKALRDGARVSEANFNWHLTNFRKHLKNISPDFESLYFPERSDDVPKKTVLPAQSTSKEKTA